MPVDDFGAAVRDLVRQVAAMPLGAGARIRVDAHPCREAEVRTALADMPAGLPQVGLQLDEQCPPDSVHVRPWWPPTPPSAAEPRTLTLPGQDDPPWLLRYLEAARVLDVDVIRAGSLRGCPQVAGTCPACGAASLGLASGGFVTCASLSCPNPSAASEALHA